MTTGSRKEMPRDDAKLALAVALSEIIPAENLGGVIERTVEIVGLIDAIVRAAVVEAEGRWRHRYWGELVSRHLAEGDNYERACVRADAKVAAEGRAMAENPLDGGRP